MGAVLREVVANVLNCDIVVSEFELKSCNYVHFQTNSLEKGINPLTPSLWLKFLNLFSSTRMDLTLDNP